MRKTAEHRDKTYKSTNRIIKNGFVGGIIILTVSNLLVKVTGLLFKIPMNYIMGDMGMGYYNSAYSIYTLFYMLATSGLPVAISVTVSEKRAQGKIGSAKKVFHLSLAVFAAIGFLAFALMFFASYKLAALISSELSAMSVTAAAPTILFVCVSGAYRGYFQGCGNMMPTAVSQLIEAMGKLLIGIACALYAIRIGAEIHVVAACAVFGLTAGSFVGMLYLIITGFVRGDRDLVTEHEIDYTSDKIGSIFRRFLAISIPVTLSASVMSLTNTLDTAMIQRILILSGMTAEEAAAAYGNYTSLAVPLFNLPPVLIYPIAYSLVPAVAAAVGEGKIETARDKITMSLRYALIIGLPCAMGLSALSDPILCLLYNDTSAHAAAMLLTLLAPSSLLVCILAITNSVLQGCGKEKMPVISMLVGGGVKLLSGMLFIKMNGISGAPMSTFLCYLTVTVMNLAFTVRYTKVRLTPGMLYKPLLSAVVCSLSALLFNSILKPALGSSLACVSSVLVAAAVYLTMLILLGEVSLTEINKIIKSKSKKRKNDYDNGRKKKQLVNEKNHDFNSLRMLTEVLRGKGGCPWDMEQTHESIRNDIIEETYEVVEAIDNSDAELLREELGDVLFQVMFHSRIEEEAERFSVDDVINEVCEKMISRHPHVFGDVNVSGSSEVLENWETIKKAEKDRKTVKESMQSVPKQLPSLMRTRKIVKKAKKDGFDFAVTENDIISLAEKLKTAQGDEREELITDIVFSSVVLSDGADIEKHLGEKTDEFINYYKE